MTSTGVNWASRPTMKLVADVYNGPGPASTYEAADAWRALSAGLAAADTEFADAMKLARGNWEGPAADAAQAALAPFSEWAATAEAIANALSAQAAFNAGAFSTTKAAMPSPAEVAAVAAVKDNPVDKVVGLLTAVPTPGEVAESVAAAQQAQAAIAMTGYDASTGLVDSYLTLRPPPHLSTGVISAGTMAGNTASYGDFGDGASQFYAATTSAGAAYHAAAGSADGSAGSSSAGSSSAGSSSAGSGGHGPTGGSSVSGDVRGTHPAGIAGYTAASPGGVGSGGGSGGSGGGSGGSANNGTGAGSHSGGSQSIAAAAGLGAGTGALGLGTSRTFSGPEALGRSTGGFGGTSSVPGSGGSGASGASGAGGAGGAGGARAGGLGGTSSSGGGVSGSAATAAEGSARGPLSAGSTSAVGASGEALGAPGVGGAAGHAAAGGRGSGGRGSGGLGAGTGAGRSNGQDDDEHEIPDYLKDLEHFTDGRVVAPPVIGADDAL